MNYLHSELSVPAGRVVHVTLSGQAANVRVLDGPNFDRYREGQEFEAAAGGYYTSSPVVLSPPSPGVWHLVIDLAGGAGEVQASVAVRRA